MSEIAFVDTNILIYAHDRDAGAKQSAAARVLARLWDERSGRVSVQVLQEFYVTVTQKLTTPVRRATAREIVSTYGAWVHAPTTVDTLLRATEISELAQLSFWDALILAAAEAAGAQVLYTEDLNTGQSVAGVRIVNPLQ